VWTWRQLGYHDQPIGLLNVDGYYDSLLQFMRHSESEGFVSTPTIAMVQVHQDPHTLLLQLAHQAGRALAPDDYSKI
jgi:predicted Rossmann-fold nucleotide-binding protein